MDMDTHHCQHVYNVYVTDACAFSFTEKNSKLKHIKTLSTSMLSSSAAQTKTLTAARAMTFSVLIFDAIAELHYLRQWRKIYL